MADDGDIVRSKTSNSLESVVTLAQELTGKVVQSDSLSELFDAAFQALFKCLPFDAGVGVLVEQNLDLYVSRRRNVELSDPLVGTVRRILEPNIPASFASADVMVRSESNALEEGTPGSKPEHEIHSVLRHDLVTAGILVLFRKEDFSEDEQNVLEIFSAQVSLLLSLLRARSAIDGLTDIDELTGVGNRRHFKRQLGLEMERARVYGLPLSLLMIDIDDFKSFSDGHGDLAGNIVLSELCGMIRESVRGPDDIARFDIDEFAVILPHTDLEGARATAERILARVRAMEVAKCTVSIGVAEYEATDRSIADLVRRADDRLYDAKRNGKNRLSL
jgi:diguanylate cyclase (GGDEF)-like protein